MLAQLCIISLRANAWAYKTRQESEQSCICFSGIDFPPFYRDFYWILEMLDDVLTFSFLIILTLKVPLLSECNHFKQYFDFAGTIFNQKNDARRVLIRPSLR